MLNKLQELKEGWPEIKELFKAAFNTMSTFTKFMFCSFIFLFFLSLIAGDFIYATMCSIIILSDLMIAFKDVEINELKGIVNQLLEQIND